jgi:DNA-binding MarR family transcriptional regulator
MVRALHAGADGMRELESMTGWAPLVELHELDAGDEWNQRWLANLRWRRRVERALKPLKVTFAQWLVLDAMERLIRQSHDAVSQRQVAQHLQMGTASLCRLMQCLERKALVDQAPSFACTANRIFLSDEGENLARRGRARLEALGASAGAAPAAQPDTSKWCSRCRRRVA